MITILYATSEQYAPVMLVSIKSLLDTKLPSTNYRVCIMVGDDFSHEMKYEVEQLFTLDGNCEVIWINMHGYFQHTVENSAGVGKHSNYRLLAAELVHEDRCIYLDADTLVLRDLSRFWSFDLKDMLLAGVHSEYFINKSTGGYTHPHFEKYRQMMERHVGSLKYDQYIGAGVMLMNLRLLREKNKTDCFLKEIPMMSGPLDQDILNACCYGAICALPPEYCIDLHDIEDISWYEKHLPKKAEKIRQAILSPSIIHFSDRFKPWNTLGIQFEKQWWNYAYASGAAVLLWDSLVDRYLRPTDYYEQEYKRVTNSVSFKIGRTITLLPRKIISLVKK